MAHCTGVKVALRTGNQFVPLEKRHTIYIMKIYSPIKKTVWGKVTSQQELESAIDKSGQRFGVDESGPACNVVADAPCSITYYEYLGFGSHKGIDLPVATGTQVYASTNGKVSRVSDKVTSGIGVVIWDSSQSIETVYWHLKSHYVNVGDMVVIGQLIGISNNTGYSIGPHLHFQVNLTNEHGQSLNAVDPLPYFVWTTMDRLVKADKDVYRIKDGKKDLFLNSKSFISLDGRWDKIETISQAELDAFPTGDVLIAVSNE